MLGHYGELGRLYLAPEDPMVRKRRKQAGGNSGKNFTEGWVEFEDKSVAKRVRAQHRRFQFHCKACWRDEGSALLATAFASRGLQ